MNGDKPAPTVKEALQQLMDAADISDDSGYGTISTDYVRKIARSALAAAPQPIGYILPGGLPALKTPGGWLIVHGQPAGGFTEPLFAATGAAGASCCGGTGWLSSMTPCGQCTPSGGVREGS